MSLRTAALLAACLPALLGGCRIGAPPPEPVPLRGPSPERVAIWPVVVGQGAGPSGPLLIGLDRAVRARGYLVPSLAVGQQLLVEKDVALADDGAPADLVAAGQALSADAVLLLHARRFDAQEQPWRGASWDLTWQLVSTRGHGVLWEQDHAGAWWRQMRDDSDPLARPTDDLQLVPIGAGAQPSYSSVEDLMRTLHRFVCEQLPRAVPSPER